MGYGYTKARLYEAVHRYKTLLGHNINDYKIDTMRTCKDNNIHVQGLEFVTKGLRGMAIVGNNYENDIILLNNKRTKSEQYFDCSHELIHLGLHRNMNKSSFNCIDKIYANQDSFLEWQANEGAAEFCVPYKVLLTLIKENADLLDTFMGIDTLKLELAEYFGVTIQVIHFRFESLKYEIHQYLNGTKLEDIVLTSAAQLKQDNIKIASINDKEDYYFKKWKLSKLV